MNYLFNDSAEQATSTRDVWLTSKGEPVLATKLSADFGAVPQGGKMVGRIDADNTAPYQLSKGNELTESGQNYCDAMGADHSVEGLKKFISRNKHTSVKVDAVISSAPVPA